MAKDYEDRRLQIPWSTRQDVDEGFVQWSVWSADEAYVAECLSWPDACLIAKAPEMLALLRELDALKDRDDLGDVCARAKGLLADLADDG